MQAPFDFSQRCPILRAAIVQLSHGDPAERQQAEHLRALLSRDPQGAATVEHVMSRRVYDVLVTEAVRRCREEN